MYHLLSTDESQKQYQDESQKQYQVQANSDGATQS